MCLIYTDRRHVSTNLQWLNSNTHGMWLFFQSTYYPVKVNCEGVGWGAIYVPQHKVVFLVNLQLKHNEQFNTDNNRNIDLNGGSFRKSLISSWIIVVNSYSRGHVSYFFCSSAILSIAFHTWNLLQIALDYLFCWMYLILHLNVFYQYCCHSHIST